MLQKVFLIIVGISITVWATYAYQQRVESNILGLKKQEIVRAYNTFFPEEWSYNDPLQDYEKDSLSDVVGHYRWDYENSRIEYIADPANIFSSIVMSGVDYMSFTPIDQVWSKDNNGLYYAGILVLQTNDIPRFLDGSRYLVNNSQVFSYWEWKIDEIVWADRDTFDTLFSIDYFNQIPYAKDKNKVYMVGQIIPDIESSSVEILSNFYLRDKKKIVYSDWNHHIVLKGVDLKTFRVESGDGYDSKDKKWYFYQWERVDMIEF